MIPGVKRLVVSAPFGNWVRRPFATSTLGTFTREYRGGLLYRLWRMALTLRYDRRSQSWINRLGLPNPGIRSVGCCCDCIVSVIGFTQWEWSYLLHCTSPAVGGVAVELNLSCPNVTHGGIREILAACVPAIRAYSGPPLIAKLPPVRWMDFARPLWDAGVRAFHLCNTIPTPGGGLSGAPLQQYSLWATEEVRREFQGADIIGGGGVRGPEDVQRFLDVGADHVAVGSMLLNPFNWSRLRRLADER